MSFRATLLAGLALALIATALAAAEGEPPLHVGLQATLTAPRQDLRTFTQGSALGGGLFFEQDLDDQWSVRTRLDFVPFGSAVAAKTATPAGLLPPGALRVTANLASVGGDVRLRPFKDGPVFLLGGLYLGRLEVKTSGDPAVPVANGPIAPTRNRTGLKIGLALGAGCRVLGPASFTVRYAVLPVDGAALGTLEMGLDYRF